MNWVLVDTSTVTINNVYLSMVSAQGALYVAEGSQILCWAEELAKIAQEDDFVDGNSLIFVGQSAIATVIPGDAGVLEYTINYDVTVNSSPTQDTLITVEFLHEAVVLGQKAFFVSRTEVFPFVFLDSLHLRVEIEMNVFLAEFFGDKLANTTIEISQEQTTPVD